ncbi:MAG: sulfite exporter TauE/SafE family protein [Candidatus Omnitrophota bacterium]
MLELSLWLIILIAVIAFLCEYMDSTLGMGYGTTLTPVLMLFGFAPIQIVPSVLLSELITGIIGGIFHHREGNVNLKPKTTNIPLIWKKLNSLGYVESYKRGIPLHLKVVFMLVLSSIIGAVSAVFTAQILPKFLVQLYISVLVISMGIIILICLNKEFPFSWFKIFGIGSIASFNKGLTGGGYGPLIVSGQVLSGIEGKSAVGTTSLAEGLTCLIGVITYILTSKNPIDWKLAPIIITGAILSVPLSAKSVKKISSKRLKLIIGIFTIVLGIITLIKILKK